MDVIKAGNLNPRKLPAGHMKFGEKGKNELIVYQGEPYNSRGEKLPLNIEYLRVNEYPTDKQVLKHLLPAAEPAKTKGCSKCATPLPVEAKFCHECATPQAVQLPGQQDFERIRQFIDPTDPFGSLELLESPPDKTQVRRQTPEEIQAELLAQDPYKDLQAIGRTIQGVPGEPPVPFKPEMAVVPKAVVEFATPDKR